MPAPSRATLACGLGPVFSVGDTVPLGSVDISDKTFALNYASQSGHWLTLWRSSGEILNHGCKSLRSDFHRAGERMIDLHNGQQPGKN